MEENQELFSLSVDPDSKYNLAEAGRWARILAICGTIFLLIIVAGLVIQLITLSRFSSVFQGESTQGLFTGIIVGYFVVLVIIFFPLLYLFRFSGRLKDALESNDQNGLNESFRYMKLYFRYLGIITIIGLTLLALSFFISLVGRSTF